MTVKNAEMQSSSLATALPRGISRQFLLPRPRLVLEVCSLNLPRNENFDFDNYFFDRPA